MTTERDIERLLDRWMADGPMEVSDRVFDEVVDRLRSEPQRPAWRVHWRDIHVSTPLRFSAAAAAVAVVAVVGLGLFGRPGDSGVGVGAGPTASRTAGESAAPSPTPGRTPRLCQPDLPGCIGLLAPGVHSTSEIITPFTYRVPEGWSKPLDVRGAVNLEPPTPGTGFIGIWPDWAVIDGDSCTTAAAPDLGRTVDDLVTWLTEHPGLIATEPSPVTVGGLDGRVLDISKDPDWTGPCPGTVNLFTHAGTINDVGWLDINDAQRMRMYFLDAGDGHVVTIDILADSSDAFDALVEAATPIVESFDFGSTP